MGISSTSFSFARQTHPKAVLSTRRLLLLPSPPSAPPPRARFSHSTHTPVSQLPQPQHLLLSQHLLLPPSLHQQLLSLPHLCSASSNLKMSSRTLPTDTLTSTLPSTSQATPTWECQELTALLMPMASSRPPPMLLMVLASVSMPPTCP